MKQFDKEKPLILIHIPKTAGMSVKEIYKGWFGDNLLFHYKDWSNNSLPNKHSLYIDSDNKNPNVIYGHFNSGAGFGIEQYYPEANQFVTILRDPFEIAVSGYFYMKLNKPDWRERLNLQAGGLREYISELQSNVLDYFPVKVREDNYKQVIEELFIEIGVMEYLDESMIRISTKLGKPYTPNSLSKLNTSKRCGEKIPIDLKEDFKQRHELEYKLYNYVLSRYQ